MKAGQHNPGHRYGCWGTNRGGEDTVLLPGAIRNVYASDHVLERRQVMKPVTTGWLDITCGHNLRNEDVACIGCPNLSEKQTEGVV